MHDYRYFGANVYIAIYAANPSARWRDKPVKQLQVALDESSPMNLNTDLPPGRYALRAFVDRNGNGELDLHQGGKPSEPFAFSRAAGAANSLRFHAAVVEVGDGQGAVVLQFVHPKPDAKVPTPAVP